MAIDCIDSVLCDGCGICVMNCPMDVIRMEKKNEKAYIKYPEDCMICGVCLECPQKAIRLVPGYNRPIALGWG